MYLQIYNVCTFSYVHDTTVADTTCVVSFVIILFIINNFQFLFEKESLIATTASQRTIGSSSALDNNPALLSGASDRVSSSGIVVVIVVVVIIMTMVPISATIPFALIVIAFTNADTITTVPNHWSSKRVVTVVVAESVASSVATVLTGGYQLI